MCPPCNLAVPAGFAPALPATAATAQGLPQVAADPAKAARAAVPRAGALARLLAPAGPQGVSAAFADADWAGNDAHDGKAGLSRGDLRPAKAMDGSVCGVASEVVPTGAMDAAFAASLALPRPGDLPASENKTGRTGVDMGDRRHAGVTGGGQHADCTPDNNGAITFCRGQH